MVFYRTINFLANCLFIFLALDPAKPWFDITDLSNTLSKGDASLVDVIHTKSGRLYNVSTMYIIHKVQLFREGHKNLRNCPYGFDVY